MMEKLVIFGCGRCLEEHWDMINKCYIVDGIVDNDSLKWGSTFHGVVIKNPIELQIQSCEKILIAIANSKIRRQIEMQIAEYGAYCILDLSEVIPPSICETNVESEFVYKDAYDNEIIIDDSVNIKRLEVDFHGCNNIVQIEQNVTVKKEIKIYCAGNNNKIFIGNHTTMVDAYLEAGEQGEINIGSDCMISWGIELFQNPTHPIYDMSNGYRTNTSKAINIGEHVWIGKDVCMLNGFTIGYGSVVGMKSVSSGRFGEHMIIAGNPAKIVRENIEWKRDLTGYYPLDCI